MKRVAILTVSIAATGIFCMTGRAQEALTIMEPDIATYRSWLEAHERAPKASIDPALKSRKGSVNLLSHLEYIPSQRDQGSCNNCWAWAATGCVAIALDVQEGINDRLSMQYINSCADETVGNRPCCHTGWLDVASDFYATAGKALPWTNVSADWRDGSAACETTCSSIGVYPSYRITSMTDQRISTWNEEQDTAIGNIKNVLDQGKAVWFAYALPNTADWDNFRDFWSNESEDTVWNPDYSCGHTWSTGCGVHAVMCVGYDDTDPDNRYWIMLNSWGTANGNRPNGIFRMDMDMNYSCRVYDQPDWYMSFSWETIDVTFDIISTDKVDIGLRYFDGTDTVTFACEAGTPTSPLQIRKGSRTFGIMLVAPSDPMATGFTIQTSGGTKAVRRY